MSRINVGKVSPIPKGNWVQTNSYEKLNMVNRSGVLYIAKQDVPANTAITNENYWMKATNSLSIGTVNTVAYDTPASATITEGENSPILNLNLPRGASGGEIIDDSAQSTDRVWSANKVNNTVLDKLDVDNTTISGDIVTFESERVEPIKDLKVINIEPVQDLNGYDAPWPAGGGKNLFNKDNGDVSWFISSDKITNSANGKSVFIPCDASTTYTVSKTVGFRFSVGYTEETPAIGVSVYNVQSDNYVSVITITTGANATHLVVYFWNGAYDTVTEADMLASIQIEKGSSATSFAPYSNICPITGHTQAVITRTGKNLFDSSRLLTLPNWTENEGVYSGLTSGLKNFVFYDNLSAQAGQFAIQCSSFVDNSTLRSGYITIAYTDGSTSNIEIIGQSWQNKSFITTAGKIVNKIYYLASNVTVNLSLKDIQIELGSSATDYEPYQGTTLDITFPSEAGTVYGGTVDVTNGVLTVDRTIVDLGTLTWAIENPLTESQSPRFRSGGIKDFVDPTVISSVNQNVVDAKCSKYFLSANPIYGRTEDGSFCIATANKMIYVIDNACNSAEAFKTANSGTQLVYPLTTPITYQLTPQQLTTLLGTNHIWSDAGDTEVTLRIQAGDLAFLDTLDYNSDKLINKPDIPSMLSTRATSIVESDSGAMVTIEDGAENMPVKALSVGIEPVQDLHGYDSPWPAGGGKNFLPIDPIYNTSNSPSITRTYDDNIITITGTVTVENSFLYVQNINDTVKGKGIVTISSALISGSFDNIAVRVNEVENGTVLNRWAFTGTSRTFTANDNYDYELIIFISSSATIGSSVNAKFSLQLELGSSTTDYAPYSNICPITGHTQAVVTRTGKNLLGISDFSFTGSGISYSYNSTTNVLTFSGTPTDSGGHNAETIYIPVTGIYTLSAKYNIVTGDAFQVILRKKSTNTNIVYITPLEPTKSVELEKGEYYLRFSGRTNNVETSGTVSEFQLELGSTATDYEPYSGTILDITFPTESGTVYGGTVDVSNRVLKVDRVRHVVSTNDTAVFGWVGSNSTRIGIRLVANNKETGASVEGLKCNILNPTTSALNQDIYGNCCIYYDGTYMNFMARVPSGLEQISDRLNWLVANNCEFTYPLATPITYTLTPQQMTLLLGQNHIWADTGDVTVEYRADTKLYIDNAIAKSQTATRSLITGIESAMVATQNYTTGALIIVGDDLYKATANIASGSTLTVGTNVSKITLAQYILEQLSA